MMDDYILQVRWFQSTLPRGERRQGHHVMAATIGVSIHAPARGATIILMIDLTISCVFQSTLPRGERRFKVSNISCLCPGFNPRSREGSDVCGLTFGFAIHSFNPRSREGSDLLSPLDNGPAILQFQSTLPRGERRPCDFGPGIVYLVSIHAPARGATRYTTD